MNIFLDYNDKNSYMAGSALNFSKGSNDFGTYQAYRSAFLDITNVHRGTNFMATKK